MVWKELVQIQNWVMYLLLYFPGNRYFLYQFRVKLLFQLKFELSFPPSDLKRYLYIKEDNDEKYSSPLFNAPKRSH